MTMQESTTRPLLPPPQPTVARAARLGGLLLAWFVAGVHLGLAEERYRAAPWVGAVFVAAALVLVVAAAVAAGERALPSAFVTGAWLAGAGTAAALLALFVLSHTTGLPQYHRSDVPVLQVLSGVAEAAYVLVSIRALRSRRSGRRGR
jgi:uncharacterized membrane protein YkvI